MFTSKLRQKRLLGKQKAAEEELLEACSSPPVDFTRIQAIVTEFPSSIKATNTNGDLPLHLACFNGASMDTVEYLVKHYPESLHISDNQGALALHWACFGTCDLLIIKNLILHNQSSISQETNNQQVALHYACTGNGRLEVAQYLVEKWHDGIKHQNSQGLLPLHIACSAAKHANLELIEFLVEQYPASIQVKTASGERPVDKAIASGARQSVVLYLQSMDSNKRKTKPLPTTSQPEAAQDHPPNPKRPAPPVATKSQPKIPKVFAEHPQSITSAHHLGMSTTLDTTPSSIEAKLLHICSEPSVTVDQIEPLLQQDPDAIMCKTAKGMRPIHIVCWKGASADVVEYLVEKWPASLHARTTREWIPLHVACASDNKEVQLDVIKCLISHQETCVKAKDNKERIPLHVACFSRAPLPVIQYLVQVWPDSIMAMNNFASLPLHLACGTKASLDVIQFLVNSKPESLQAVDVEGRTPLDMAREPLQSDSPDAETVEWLEHVTDQLEKSKRREEGVFEKERWKLKHVISGEKDKPVAVSREYVDTIMSTEEKLGTGYFGVVFLGEDTVLKQKFAIKSIDRKLLVGGNKEDLDRVKRAFKKEQKGLLRFRHPNIALLYGYCLSDSQRKGEFLLYDLAEKGSLDQFWMSQLGRERLSLFGLRAQIALNTFIGLRFLHVGNRYIQPSFHRDLKSANIVLKRDMTAQLIDCGLATFEQSDDMNQTQMSTGVKGTRGYMCPKYCAGSIPYNESCDIFSFGIVLAELWSGQLQNHRDANGRVYNFYEQYVNSDNPRNMDDDLDKAFGFGVGDKIPVIMSEYKNLALDCMARSPKKRPTGEDVMDRLEIIWHSYHNVASEGDTETDSREESMDESSVSGSDSNVFAPSDVNSKSKNPTEVTGDDTNQTEMAPICRLCRTYTADGSSEECLMCLALQQQREAIAKTVSIELDASSSAVQDFHYPPFAVAGSSMPFKPQIDLRLDNPIPRLFCIVPEALKGGWKHPRLWLRRQVATRYNLFFICGHTYQVIHPPIKLTVSSVWVDKIALTLAVSLTMLKIAAEKFGGINDDSPSGLKLDHLNELLSEVKKILKDQGDRLHILECIQSEIRLSDKDVSLLNGEAYELICEKAREDRGWRSVMEPVREADNPHIVWISRIVALDPICDYEIVNV